MKERMQQDDGPSPRRPRWVGWALIVVMALVVLGMLNLGWRILLPGLGGAQVAVDPSGQSQEQLMVAQGRTLVEGSSCMRCHGMERQYVGPSYLQISARYRERADAVDYLARKIREGSVGEWGRAIMPSQSQVTEAQARQMAQWLLSLAPTVEAPSAGVPADMR